MDMKIAIYNVLRFSAILLIHGQINAGCIVEITVIFSKESSYHSNGVPTSGPG